MNTIKIKLSTSGRIAALDKNFPLYCGQFNNVLLNILVPTAILSGGFEVGQVENTLDPTNAADEIALNTLLTAYIKTFTGDETRPHTGDVVFYIYNNAGVLTYYKATFDGAVWGFTEVDYFDFGSAGANVKIGMVGTFTNGVVFKSKSYYTRFVKKFTNEGVEYALYERKMPKEFTDVVGDQTLVINVENIAGENITNIVTSQTATLPILRSTVLDSDEAVEASELSRLEADMNTLAEDMQRKQDKQDNDIQFTTEKTVVGALNNLNTREIADRVDIDDNASEIAKIKNGTTKVPSAAYADEAGFATNDSAGDNIATEFSGVKNRLTDLETIIGTGEHYVGTMTITTDIVPLPDPSTALNHFVQVQTHDQNRPRGGDTVIIIQKISDATDKTYKYIFNGTAWIGYEIPPVELAENGTAGLVSGTWNIGDTSNTLVDIVGGKIKNIWVKLNGSYLNIVYVFGVLNTNITNIINGTQVVGEAQKATKDSANNNIATQFSNILNGVDKVGAAALADDALKATADALGNNIVNTYLTKAAGATKQYVKDYALPKQFNDVLYLATAGFSEEIPTTPASGIQFSATSSAIGETKLAECDYELDDVKFQLARKNSYTARYYIAASTDTGETLQFKLETYAVINGVEVLLHSELTTPKLIPAALAAFDFGDAFAELGNTVLEMETGDKIRQKLYVVREDSNTVTFDVYSNSTYPSSFYLNTTLEVGIAMIRRASEAFTLYDNGWEAANDIAPFAYKALLQLPFELDENSYVELIVDPIIAAKYGFVIGAANGDEVTFYALELPTEDILLKLIIDNLGTLNEVEDNYRWGYVFYLRNAEVEQVDDDLEVEE